MKKVAPVFATVVKEAVAPPKSNSGFERARPGELFWLAAIFGLLSFQFEWNQTSSNPVWRPR